MGIEKIDKDEKSFFYLFFCLVGGKSERRDRSEKVNQCGEKNKKLINAVRRISFLWRIRNILKPNKTIFFNFYKVF